MHLVKLILTSFLRSFSLLTSWRLPYVRNELIINIICYTLPLYILTLFNFRTVSGAIHQRTRWQLSPARLCCSALLRRHQRRAPTSTPLTQIRLRLETGIAAWLVCMLWRSLAAISTAHAHKLLLPLVLKHILITIFRAFCWLKLKKLLSFWCVAGQLTSSLMRRTTNEKQKTKKKQGRQVVAAAYENVITKLTSGTFTAAAHAQQLNLVWSRGLDAPLGHYHATNTCFVLRCAQF